MTKENATEKDINASLIIERSEGYQQGIKLLARQNYSKQKLMLKLLSKGFDKNEISQAIIHLEEKGLINEQAYAANRCHYWHNKKYSLNLIEQKLKIDGVNLSLEEIKATIDSERNDPDSEEDKIHALLSKKKNDLQLLQSSDFTKRRKSYRKLLSFLLSRGHSFNTCKKILTNYSAINREFSDEFDSEI